MTTLAVADLSAGIVDPHYVLRAYGAVILSFLGGIQWGLAIRKSGGSARTRQGLTPVLALSVFPSLIGWAGLLTEESLGFGLLILGFVLVLISDVRAVNRGMAPRWYLRLRYPLTGLVIICLTIAAAYQP